MAALMVAVGSRSAHAADRWTDISDTQWAQVYGLSADQVATVAQGFADGSFHPAQAVLRGQFVKMVVSAFDLPTAAPLTPSFADLSPADYYYPWVEGAVAAGLVTSASGEEFNPAIPITREDTGSLLAPELAQRELKACGSIIGGRGDYQSIAAWYAAEGSSVLGYFADESVLRPADAPATAYLIYHSIVQGSAREGNLWLDPGASLTRAQAVALILRARALTFGPIAPKVPAVSALGPVEGPEAGGNKVAIIGSGFKGATAVSFGDKILAAQDFTVVSDTQIDVASVPAGTGSADVVVTTPRGKSAGTPQDVYTYLLLLGTGDAIVQEAIQFLGVPYVWAGDDPDGFDCSGFVMYVFGQLGTSLPHNAALQSEQGSPVPRDQLAPGDLVFFGSPAYHVGIYVGDGNMINAPYTGTFVRIESVDWSDFSGAVRVPVTG